jgi:hypothetical protein
MGLSLCPDIISFPEEKQQQSNIDVLFKARLNNYHDIFSLFTKAETPRLQSSLSLALAFISAANVNASSKGSVCTFAIICLVTPIL